MTLAHRQLKWVLMAAVLMLAACDRDRAKPAVTNRADSKAAPVSELAWQARLPCADCDGIATELVLSQHNDERRYRMQETFLGAGVRDASFEERGIWSQQGDLIHLETESGAHRVFALLANGQLQPRDFRGQPFALREGDLLTPVSAETAR